MITREKERARDLLIFEQRIPYHNYMMYLELIDHILDYLIVHPLSKPRNN
jgi:hypothetical protein